MRNWIHVLLFIAMLPAAVNATALRAVADRIEAAGVEATSLDLQVDWSDGTERGELILRAQTLRLGDTGLHFKNARWRCSLESVVRGWRCAGAIEADGLKRGRLVVSSTESATHAELANGKAKITVAAELADPSMITTQVTQVPMDWLQPLLSKVWPDATFIAGTLSAQFEIPVDAASGPLSGDIELQSLGLDTRDGRLAASGLSFAGSLELALSATTEVTLNGHVKGAELLVGSTYIELPASPIAFAINTKNETADEWTIGRLHWRDDQILQLDGTARLDLADEPWRKAEWLTQLNLQAESANLEGLSARYLQSLLAGAGMPKASAGGAGSLNLKKAGAEHFIVGIKLSDVVLDSGDGRLQAAGVTGNAHVTSESAAETSRIAWQSVNLYGIALGPGIVQATSRLGGFQVSSPVSIGVVGGSLEIQALRWQPSAASTIGESQFELSLALADLDLALLSEQLGWPPFVGRLSGRLPKASFANNMLSLDGGLEVDVFDGRVRVDALQLERPFGVAPTLSANVTLRDLAMQPLTAAFGFGEITGRLDGDIRELRLVDWEPVAFDARFRTVTRKGVERRISQRAVSDLSRVGGGFTGGLQSSALRVFESFGYSEIGLGCRLHNNVCEMSGISGGVSGGGEAGSSKAGYTVVEGSGLPRITVNGFARQVDWPVLVARLKAVTEGQSPRVE